MSLIYVTRRGCSPQGTLVEGKDSKLATVTQYLGAVSLKGVSSRASLD